MRPSIYVTLALLASSCANYETCPAHPPVPRFAVAVISDIDDTIRDTRLKIGETHIPNPGIVLDPWRRWHPVNGMARFYQMRKWNQRYGVSVIYVSAGPCSYADRLKYWIPRCKFPRGDVLLRLNAPFPPPPHDYKTKAICRIINRSPGKHFILVGDSGEHDPECYGDLARKYRGRVDAIYIRRISGSEPRRYARAFARIDPAKIHFIPASLER
jgi:phosphatidate phosphatase APP1